VVVEIGEGINNDIEVCVYAKRTKGRRCVDDIDLPTW
jgi:hypothetical protein